MLDGRVAKRRNPIVPSALPDRVFRCRKGRISKRSHRHEDQAGKCLSLPINSRAADGAELECHGTASVRQTGELGGVTRDGGYLLSAEPCLVAKHRPGPTLALKAVAHRNPRRFALANDLQLSTSARCAARCHGRFLKLKVLLIRPLSCEVRWLQLRRGSNGAY